MLREHGIEVIEDDIGRPSIRREDARVLVAERRKHERQQAAQQAEKAAASKVTVPAGVPAVEGASPFESLVAAGGVVLPSEEFAGRPKPNFLAEEIEAGQRQQATERAEREAVENARRSLEGRDR